jgi:hypothetical protein
MLPQAEMNRLVFPGSFSTDVLGNTPASFRINPNMLLDPEAKEYSYLWLLFSSSMISPSYSRVFG